MLKPTIKGAISSISKGITQLEAVIADSMKTADQAIAAIDAAQVKRDAAAADAERAKRIKSKLEDLVS